MQYDIIIIGTGAGGSTIAHKLAPSGKKILILERGDFIPREKENWDPVEVAAKGRYRTKEKWFDKNNEAFEPYTHYCVGGNTKMYGAALLRLRQNDFKEVKHFDGVSPAWPINYNDLEKYYSEAEQLYSVHGHHGYDPTEPYSSTSYPFPALKMEDDMRELFTQFQSLGYHPFPCPIAVRIDENKKGASPVHLCNFDGFPDLTEAKADAHVVALQNALSHPNVTLMRNCLAEKLITDASGKRVVSVEVIHNSKKIILSADSIIVSCGAINSAALFLKSTNDKHPYGLANSSDQVGRNYMAHNNGALIVVSQKENRSQFQKAFGVADFYHGNDENKFPLGAIQLMGKTDYDTLNSLAKDVLPGMSAEEISTHSIDFWITAEDLPRAENRVTLTDDGSIKLSVTQANREAYNRLKTKLKSIISKIAEKDEEFKDAVYIGYDLGVSGVSHQNGTLRFGTDAQTSVLDVNCKTHDLENVYVVDASFFPSCGAVNPSLTIMANALRVGEHILKQVSPYALNNTNQSVKQEKNSSRMYLNLF
ncbi:MAG: GMC family oxidoreductase [Bacteroidia bacterium]